MEVETEAFTFIAWHLAQPRIREDYVDAEVEKSTGPVYTAYSLTQSTLIHSHYWTMLRSP